MPATTPSQHVSQHKLFKQVKTLNNAYFMWWEQEMIMRTSRPKTAIIPDAFWNFGRNTAVFFFFKLASAVIS